MTRKQHKAIAEMWAAGLLLQAGIDSFGNDVSIKDAHAIVNEVDKIALKLQNGRNQKFTLKETIDAIIKPKEVSNGS